MPPEVTSPDLPEPTATGSFAKTPLAHLLVYAYDRELTGTFDFSGPTGQSVTVLFIEGQPTKARTSEVSVYLGRVLFELGILTEEQLGILLPRLLGSKELHGQVLISEGLITEEQLELALRAQLVRQMQSLVHLPAETTYKFYDCFDGLAAYGGDGHVGIDPFPIVWACIRDEPPWEHVQVGLARVGTSGLKLTDASETSRFSFEKAERATVELLRQKPWRLPELTSTGTLAPRLTQLLVYCLLVTKQVELVRESKLPAGTPAAPPSSADDIPDAPPSSPFATNVMAPPPAPRKVARVQLAQRPVTRAPIIIEEEAGAERTTPEGEDGRTSYVATQPRSFTKKRKTKADAPATSPSEAALPDAPSQTSLIPDAAAAAPAPVAAVDEAIPDATPAAVAASVPAPPIVAPIADADIEPPSAILDAPAPVAPAQASAAPPAAVVPAPSPPPVAVAPPPAAAEPEPDPFAGFTLDSEPPPAAPPAPPPASPQTALAAAPAPATRVSEPPTQTPTAPPPASESDEIFRIETPAQGIPIVDAGSIDAHEPAEVRPPRRPAEVHTRPTVPKMSAITPDQIAAHVSTAKAPEPGVAPTSDPKPARRRPESFTGDPKSPQPPDVKSSRPAPAVPQSLSIPTPVAVAPVTDPRAMRPTQPALPAQSAPTGETARAPLAARPAVPQQRPNSPAVRATPPPAMAGSIPPSSSASSSSSSPTSNPISSGPAPSSTKPKPHVISVKEEIDDDDEPPSSRAPSPPSLRAMQMTAELVARKKEIQDKAASLDKEDYYALLGVTRETPVAEIQKAFFGLAKKWHPDRVPPVLADVKDLCAKVFGKMSEAHQTLMDPAKRAKYDTAKKPGGDESVEAQEEVRAILEAATNFQKAEICLKRNDFKMAEELCKKAIDVEPKQADYIAMMAWLQSQKPNKQDPGSTQEIVVELTRAIGISQACERAFFYRAMMLKRLGQDGPAVKDFKRAMELNPRNVDAQREVRLYNMRGGDKAAGKKDEGGGGIFGKLFKK